MPSGVKHVPTDELKQAVYGMACAGMTTEDMLFALRIKSKTTLYRHYREEIKSGGNVALGKVVGRLFRTATQGADLKAANTAGIWITKARLGWAEKSKIDHSSEDGSMIPPATILVQGVQPGES